MNNRIDKQIDSFVAALTDPIIVFDPSWADTLPDWLKVEIKMQGLIQLMTGEEGIATDAEALAYVSNASLSVPLDSEWVDIYQYLLTKVMKDKVPDELRKESPDDWQEEILGDLKQWLWQQRIKGRKQKVKEERAKAKAEAEAKAPKQLRLGV
jgi:hypothetical protein